MENGAEEIRMTRPLRILLMNRQYDNTVGGVERASIRLANEMSARGNECHILSLDMHDAEMPFPLDARVQWHRISSTSAKEKAGWSERIKRFHKIRSILQDNNIDVAMGFQDGAYLSLMTAALGTGVKIVAGERNAPTRFEYLSNKKAKHIVFNSFRFADAITVQCPSYKEQYPAYLQQKIVVIPNSVDPPKSLSIPSADRVSSKEILFVGRLDYQKNVTTLISAFGLLAARYPDWILRLVGDGPYAEKLQKKAADLGVYSQVFFEGMQKNVEKYYTGAHVFCLPSLWEGFPNVLGEAMSHGLPSVGFRRCSGVCDLIQNDVTGILVEGDVLTAQNLSENLEKLMTSADLRKSMGAASAEAMKDYRPNAVYSQWEVLFKRLAQAR